MKLKDKNDVIENLLEQSLTELSKNFTLVYKDNLLKGGGDNARFSFWINSHFLDKDKNVCVRGVVDFAVINSQGKVISFKKLIDKALVLKENVGTLEKPKYGKQLGYEELRRKILNDIASKSFASLAMSLVEQTAEQIEEFNTNIPENLLIEDDEVQTD